jgi:2-dehydro-3-deoxy-L-rhamnonate dehydrogenase (NAD+)
MRLEDQVVIVTGGGSGIGEAICRRFDEEGARVAVLDMRAEPAERVSGELTSDSVVLEVDVRDSTAVDAAVDSVVERYGRLDVLVNNAGIAGPTAPVEEYPVDEWRRVLEVNLTGAFLCLRRCIPPMRAAATGG